MYTELTYPSIIKLYKFPVHVLDIKKCWNIFFSKKIAQKIWKKKSLFITVTYRKLVFCTVHVIQTKKMKKILVYLVKSHKEHVQVIVYIQTNK